MYENTKHMAVLGLKYNTYGSYKDGTVRNQLEKGADRTQVTFSAFCLHI